MEEGGADLVNDISALSFSERMASVVAELNVPVILMHIKGTPENMQRDPSYADVVAEIKNYFQEKIDYALSHGIKKEKIILDPGIGFGKRLEDNIAIIRNLRQFAAFDLPILIGISRKSFLGTAGRRGGPGKEGSRDPGRQPAGSAQRRGHPPRPRRGQYGQGPEGLAEPGLKKFPRTAVLLYNNFNKARRA